MTAAPRLLDGRATADDVVRVLCEGPPGAWITADMAVTRYH
jgi:hypothetical protein